MAPRKVTDVWTRLGRRAKRGLIASIAVLTVIAGVAANIESIADAFDRFRPKPPGEMAPFTGGVREVGPIRDPYAQGEQEATGSQPSDESIDPGASHPTNAERGPTSEHQGAQTAVARTQMGDQADVELRSPSGQASQENKEQVKSENTAKSARSIVVVESVQAPRIEFQFYDLWYDVYLFNSSKEDVLLVAIIYDSRTDIPHGDAMDSGPLLPNAKYEIPYEFGGSDRVALTPPYLLKAGSRGAIRFHFKPTEEIDALPHWFAVDLVDSRGRRTRMIDFEGNPPRGKTMRR